MKYTIHAGHAAYGERFSGASGYCAESLVNREIVKWIIYYVRAAGHEIIDCTVDTGISQGNIISKIKKLINSQDNVEANISIHLNACKKASEDGKVKGCECLVYSYADKGAPIAHSICLELKALGFTNRGVKNRTDLGILKGIKNGGGNIIVECFFCDDEDDYQLYQKIGPEIIGKAIAQGIIGAAIPTSTMRAAKPIIKYGSKGTEVQKLQLNLNKVSNLGLVADGKCGPKTVAAIKYWQDKNNLEVDGIYGPASYATMQRLL